MWLTRGLHKPKSLADNRGLALGNFKRSNTGLANMTFIHWSLLLFVLLVLAGLVVLIRKTNPRSPE
jgi:hypothetical protein